MKQELKYLQMLKGNLSLRCPNKITNIISFSFIVSTIDPKITK